MAGLVGQKIKEDYFGLTGGLNTSASPFVITPDQATGGYNYDYTQQGALTKSKSAAKINSSADAELKSLGLTLYHDKSNNKSIIRFAGTRIQKVDLAGTFTNLTEDTVSAGSAFLTSGSTQPVVTDMVSTPDADVLWAAGGGMDSIYGVYSTSKVTKNGAVAPTGAITATVSAGGGSFSSTGTYYYAVTLQKASTGAESNAALDVSAVVTATTQTVTIDLSGLTGLDTTKYDNILIYRSSVGGSSAFTAGALVATIASTTTSYADTGSSEDSSIAVPRADSTTLDNSVLPTATYKNLCVFKRRLVAVTGSTVYISDTNKFESWPTSNTFDIPSGGPITAVAPVGFTTAESTGSDELLAIFKENELWVVSMTGDDIDTAFLKFIDTTGTLAQNLVVSANGYLYFIDNRGAYLWDGAGKPAYISMPIEDLWGVDGQLDTSKLNIGWGTFYKQQNQVVWVLSHNTVGEQKYILKLDLRFTLPRMKNTLGERVLDGVWIQGKMSNPAYSGDSFFFPTSSAQEEIFVGGDDAGYVYRLFYSATGISADDYDFTYSTPYLQCGSVGVDKKYHQVLVYVEDIGNWDLTLDYWTNFRTDEDDRNSITRQISPSSSTGLSIWDVAFWDVAYWDNYRPKPRCLVFNLSAASYNNNEGEVIKLRFNQQSNSAPITIYGFSIVYNEIGIRKVA